MTEELRKLCELFVHNRDEIKSGFGWESTYMYPLCASIYTQKRMDADVRRMKECKGLLKQMAGIFSNFRGISQLAVITLLSVNGQPQEQLNNALQVYDLLKKEFFGSDYLTIAALMLSEMSEPERYQETVSRTRRIYDLMKAEHPFLTSSQDSVFAALLALSEYSDQQLLTEMERCYEALKPHFFSSNAVQSLSHVLALAEGSAAVKCRRTMELFDSLKQQGYKYGTNEELATLGVLGLLETDIRTLAGEIMEVDDYLKIQKGFGAFGIGSKQRLMYAGILVASEYTGADQAMNAAAIQSTVSIVVAQQAAMCAAITASSAASAAANSSSN